MKDTPTKEKRPESPNTKYDKIIITIIAGTIIILGIILILKIDSAIVNITEEISDLKWKNQVFRADLNTLTDVVTGTEGRLIRIEGSSDGFVVSDPSNDWIIESAHAQLVKK